MTTRQLDHQNRIASCSYWRAQRPNHQSARVWPPHDPVFTHTRRVYFEQLASERRVVRMVRGRPVARFERKPGAKAEALDCLTYSLAARAALSLNAAAFSQREDELRAPPATPPKPRQTVFKSSWIENGPEGW